MTEDQLLAQEDTRVPLDEEATLEDDDGACNRAPENTDIEQENTALGPQSHMTSNQKMRAPLEMCNTNIPPLETALECLNSAPTSNVLNPVIENHTSAADLPKKEMDDDSEGLYASKKAKITHINELID